MFKSLSIGDEQTRSSIQNSIGKTIISIDIDEDNLYINFSDKTALRIFDGGQISTEHRYIVCYDDFENFYGSKLINVYTRPIDDIEITFGDMHESIEMEFETTNGTFMVIHNNFHNGRCSGFSIKGEITEPWISKF